MLSDDNLTLIERHLEGDLSSAEFEALEVLLAQSEEAVAYLRDTQAIQRIADTAAPQTAPPSLHQRTVAGVQARRRSSGGWRSAGYAMAASVALGVALVISYSLLETPNTDRNMAGTLVATGSRLQYEGIALAIGEEGRLVLEVDRQDSWEIRLEGIPDLSDDRLQSLNLKGSGPATHIIQGSESVSGGAKVQLTLVTSGQIVLEEWVQIQEN